MVHYLDHWFNLSILLGTLSGPFIQFKYIKCILKTDQFISVFSWKCWFIIARFQRFGHITYWNMFKSRETCDFIWEFPGNSQIKWGCGQSDFIWELPGTVAIFSEKKFTGLSKKKFIGLRPSNQAFIYLIWGIILANQAFYILNMGNDPVQLSI